MTVLGDGTVDAQTLNSGPLVGLSPREARFCREFVLTPDAPHEAYRRATEGMGVVRDMKEQHKRARKLLRTPKVRAAVKELLRIETAAVMATARRIIAELASLAFLDPAGFFNKEGVLLPIHEMSLAHRKAISSIEVVEDVRISTTKVKRTVKTGKIKFVDRLAALTKLATCLPELNPSLNDRLPAEEGDQDSVLKEFDFKQVSDEDLEVMADIMARAEVKEAEGDKDGMH